MYVCYRPLPALLAPARYPYILPYVPYIVSMLGYAVILHWLSASVYLCLWRMLTSLILAFRSVAARRLPLFLALTRVVSCTPSTRKRFPNCCVRLWITPLPLALHHSAKVPESRCGQLGWRRGFPGFSDPKHWLPSLAALINVHR